MSSNSKFFFLLKFAQFGPLVKRHFSSKIFFFRPQKYSLLSTLCFCIITVFYLYHSPESKSCVGTPAGQASLRRKKSTQAGVKGPARARKTGGPQVHTSEKIPYYTYYFSLKAFLWQNPTQRDSVKYIALYVFR